MLLHQDHVWFLMIRFELLDMWVNQRWKSVYYSGLGLIRNGISGEIIAQRSNLSDIC